MKISPNEQKYQDHCHGQRIKSSIEVASSKAAISVGRVKASVSSASIDASIIFQR